MPKRFRGIFCVLAERRFNHMQITGEEAINHLKELAAHDTSIRAVVSSGPECSFALIGKFTYSNQGFCVANKEAELSFSSDVVSCNIDLDIEATRDLSVAIGASFARFLLRNGITADFY
jgi:hypothetical protein